MSVNVLIPDQLFNQLSKLARPFVDKEPLDVIRWLVERQLSQSLGDDVTPPPTSGNAAVQSRVPRERGVVVDIDGTEIRAETVPDLIAKVMTFVSGKGKWNDVLRLAPYKTSSQRYLYSKTPKHPGGNDFWSEIKCKDLYFEAHKNYKTAFDQLAKLLSRLGMKMTYKGN